MLWGILVTAGFYNGVDGSLVGCVSCLAGLYTDQPGQTACQSCPAGLHQPNPSQSQCLQCSAGTFGNATGQTACIDCAAGSVQALAGQVNCTFCVPGLFIGVPKQTACSACSPGEDVCVCVRRRVRVSMNGSGRACSCAFALGCVGAVLACVAVRERRAGALAGLYQNGTGQLACVDCGLGLYQVLSAATSCGPCLAGLVSTGTPRSSCSACQPGAVVQRWRHRLGGLGRVGSGREALGFAMCGAVVGCGGVRYAERCGAIGSSSALHFAALRSGLVVCGLVRGGAVLCNMDLFCVGEGACVRACVHACMRACVRVCLCLQARTTT